MADSQSFEALEQAHAASVSAAHAEHNEAVAALDLQRAALQDVRDAKLVTLETEHAKELSARSRKLAQFAHLRIGAAWGAYRKSGAREDALKLAAEVRSVERETRQALGAPFHGHGADREVLGARIWTVAVTSHVAREPEALACFANQPRLGADVAIEHITSAMRTFRDPHAGAAEVVAAIESLETAVSRVARNGNRATNGREKQRLGAHKDWAHPADVEAALAAIDREDAAARSATYVAERDLIARAQNGEEIEGRDSTWHKAVRAARYAINEIARL